MSDSERRRRGLALSGGGFRASLFHLGVLARMAELDLLRGVEVISTVSGGSIVGALYYLHLKRLLESKPDARISPQDYVDAVQETILAFVAGVSKNVRMRAYANPFKAVRMAFMRSYTRSDRLAELYEEIFYRPAAARDVRLDAALAERPSDARRIRMRDLQIAPRRSDGTHDEDFQPKLGNRDRDAKVPMLYLNATTLNTGRRFLFTATWMGEQFEEGGPPDDPDVNATLRGFYYTDAGVPEKYQNLPLGVAVAASAGVPVLFPPLPLTDVYDGWLPQLVDGGLRDNAGIADLSRRLQVEFVVSDASDPMEDIHDMPPLKLGVAYRSFWIMWDRIRDQTVENAIARRFPVVYAKGPIEAAQIAPRWEPPSPSQRRAPADIDPAVASAVARIRTDLDTFSDIEADALMGAGYLIANGLENEMGGRAPAQRRRGEWRFGWILPKLARPTREIMRHLQSGRYRLTKTVQIPARVFIDWAASPGIALESGRPAFKAGQASPIAGLARAIGRLELGMRGAGDRLVRVTRDVGIRAVTSVRELAVGAVTLPVALVDLALVDRIFKKLGQRPCPVPDGPEYSWDDMRPEGREPSSPKMESELVPSS